MITRAGRPADALLGSLDAARRALLSLAIRRPTLLRILSRRDARVPAFATVQILTLLALALTWPVALFVLGPLLLGVPHLASDVRYLVLRRHVPRDVTAIACAASAVLLGLRALHGPAHLEITVATAWVVLALIAGARDRGSLWPLATLPLVAAVGALAVGRAGLAVLTLAHAHNLVGVALWAALFRRIRCSALVPLLVVVAGGLVLASPAATSLATRAGRLVAFGVDLSRSAGAFAPGLSPRVASSAVLLFVFLQAVHYSAWLAWIPQEELPGQGTFTYRMTARALVRDFGPVALVVVAAIAAGVAIAGVVDAGRAVATYMSLAAFHAYLEFAMLAYLLARGPARGAP